MWGVLEIGTVVAGRFRVERVLGAGGMGSVVVATHLQLHQQVALKVLHDRLAADRAAVERLLREARAVAQLRSEHVCRVIDAGELASGAPFIAMELLDGRDLARVLADGPLSAATAVDYVVQACVGLAEAHARGIVHRDLKPANLFVTKRLDGSPLIKLLDFGIAKAPAGEATALTQTDTVMGTPGYMAPEQLRSTRQADARADVWALGVILYQALADRMPFPATTLAELAVQIAMDAPQPLDAVPELRAAVMRCLEKAPAARFADVAELAATLAPLGGPSAAANAVLARTLLGGSAGLADTLPSGARPAADPLAATVATTLGTAAAEAQVTPPPSPRTLRRRTISIVAATVAAAAAIAGGALIVASRAGDDVGRPPIEPPTPATAPVVPAPPSSAASQPRPVDTQPPPTPITPAPVVATPPRVSTLPPRAAASPPTAAPSPKPPAASAVVSLDEAKARAREAGMTGDWSEELRYLDIILAAEPNNERAYSAAVYAACALPNATLAQRYARHLSGTALRGAQKLCLDATIDLTAPDAP